jgi:membrane protease YdiL (CAAX protease family)
MTTIPNEQGGPVPNSVIPDVSPAAAKPTLPGGPGRLVQLTELSIFLLLIVPPMIFSFIPVSSGSGAFMLIAISTIVRDLALLGLVYYLLWRNKESFARLGLHLRHVGREALLGLVLFVPMFVLASVVYNIRASSGLQPAPTQNPFQAEAGLAEVLVALLLVVVVAVSEEAIFRGYLMLRFNAAYLSPLASALVSASIFALGHGYEGSAGVVTVGSMGALLALIYLWRKSLIAPIVMHFLQDFVGIVLVLLLSMRH